MTVIRCKSNPIISVKDVKPSRDDFEIVGVLNPGVAKVNDEIVLLLRVAERPVNDDESKCIIPIYDHKTCRITVKSLDKMDESFDFSDQRVIYSREQNYLTSMSHFRVARSKDGYHFTIEDSPAMISSDAYEAFGIEDPRITYINDRYYVNYFCASDAGVTAHLASTADFRQFKREGIIFHPDNKDVVIFPQKIINKYYALHRPSTSSFGKPEMWIAESPDILCWGNHKRMACVRKGYWDSGRIGAGAVPFMTEYGWIEIYHGATEGNRYCLGAMLLDANEPWKVLARSEKPLVEPTEKYETEGFFGNVVFSCGAAVEGDNVRIYYGAADNSIACVDVTIPDILENLNLL